MGCSASRLDDDLVTLARRSQEKAVWFDPAKPAVDADDATETDDDESSDTATAPLLLSADEKSLVRSRTLLEVRMRLDDSGGVFYFEHDEAQRLAQSIVSIGGADGSASPRTTIRLWYEDEALSLRSRRSSAAESTSSREAQPAVSARPAAPPTATLEKLRRSDSADTAPPPPARRSSFDDPPPIEDVAARALATLHELVAATNGQFTEATIPPRLLSRLHHDVTRAREELENRRPETYASKSTAGKRLAIERWYEEQLRKSTVAA